MSSHSWFSRMLLPWYRENQRPLPWRRTTDPYAIWLSEVILQQTRVDQGMAYWQRFLERWPNVHALAEADPDAVMRQWQGLGYYSRARNLHAAAQQVVHGHGGRFPADPEALRQLKGVGDYTAAAIASICFGLPEPVVDGNVYRVLARVFGIDTPMDSTAGRKRFRSLAGELLDPLHPGDHNQAVMELGATVCMPVKPRCEACPVACRCLARATERIDRLPVKTGRTTLRERHFNYLHIDHPGGLILRKRTEKDIWQGLYELPLVETDRRMGRQGISQLLAERIGPGWAITSGQGPVRHVLSHQVIHARFWRVDPPQVGGLPADWIAVEAGELDRFALPRLIERYLADTL